MVEATLICTVYNEGESIEELLESIVSQSRTPDEVIFVDAGSSDGTQDTIEKYREDNNWIELVVEEGCNIAEGRNIAVENASNDFIVSTDGGCVLDEEWFEKMVAEFEDGAEYVIGMFKPEHDNLFEKVQGKIICSAHTVEELRKGNRGPSSRSVGFTRAAWEDAGGYPEDLYTGEDSKFNAQIMAAGYEPAIAGEAIVYWKMRPSWKALWDQFYTYGEGDAKGGNLFTHPSQKLGISKNFWLMSSSEATILALAAFAYSLAYRPEFALPLGAVSLALLSIPSLYYFSTLKQILFEDGLKAFLTGIAISQLKSWAWYFGFAKENLRRPKNLVKHFREAKRLR